MADITEYELEQVLFKMKANKNSAELKRQGKKLDILEIEPEVKALDEFIMRLKRGEVMVNMSKEKNIDDFTSTKVKLPEIGDVMVYEERNVSEQRKVDAMESDMEKEIKTSAELQKDEEENSKLAKYSVIPLEDKNGKRFELVIDYDGNDIGKIIYNEKGKPSFEIAPELKQKIEADLEKSNVRSFVEEQTLQEEFYLQDLGALERAIKEDKIVPETVKEVGERAIAAKNIKDKNYTTVDADKALILTPEEQFEKDKKEEVAKNRLQISEKERDIVEEEKENEEEKDNNIIPQDKKEEVEKICKREGVSLSKVKSVLVILEPKTLADSTENSHIRPYGNEITVVQFSDVVGKEKYMMIQDGIDLGRDAHDESFERLIEPLHRTKGTIKRVEDEKTTVDYTDSTGELQSMKLKRVPNDMSIQDKERFKEKLEKDLAELEMVREKDPENLALIDKLEIKVLQDFEDAGLTPPETIKEEAEEVKDEPDSQEIENDDNDCYDEIGRRIRPH